MAMGFWWRSSKTITMSSLLKVPSKLTMPGAIISAPLQMYGTAPMFTVAFGMFGRSLLDASVGKILWFDFAKIGSLSMKNISSSFVLASSMGGLNVGNC